jgi:hypothetical protein
MKIDNVSASISCKYEFSKGKRSKHPKIRINIRGLGDLDFFGFDNTRKLYPEATLQQGLCLVKAYTVDFPDKLQRTFSFGSTGDYGYVQFNAPDLGFPDEEFDNVPIKVIAVDEEAIYFEYFTPAIAQQRLAEREAQAKELEDAYRERLEEGNSVGQLPEIDEEALNALEREANQDTVSALVVRLREAMKHEGVDTLTVRA